MVVRRVFQFHHSPIFIQVVPFYEVERTRFKPATPELSIEKQAGVFSLNYRPVYPILESGRRDSNSQPSEGQIKRDFTQPKALPLSYARLSIFIPNGVERMGVEPITTECQNGKRPVSSPVELPPRLPVARASLANAAGSLKARSA